MTEVQRARTQVKVGAGVVRRAARAANRSDRLEARRALRAGNFDRAETTRPRSIAWELS